MKAIVFASLLATAYSVTDNLLNVAAPHNYMTQTAWAGGQCAAGGGTMQSPININTFTAKRPLVDPGTINFLGFGQTVAWAVGHDGNAVVAYPGVPAAGALGTLPAGEVRPMISGGALPAGVGYALSHAEFHWGATNAVGSEHSVNGIFAPLEMQMVFYKTSMNNVAMLTLAQAVLASQALGGTFDPQAVVVLNFQFRVVTADNAALAPIIAVLTATPAAVAGSAAAAATAAMNMNNLMTSGLNLADYYYYDGSLTTPGDTATNLGCLQTVRWIHYTNTLPVSVAQLAAFRGMTAIPANSFTAAGSNARAIQINTNQVWHRFVKPTKGTSVVTSMAASLLSLATFGGVYTVLNTLLPTGQESAEAEVSTAEAKVSQNNPILAMIDSFVNPQTVAPRSQFQPNAHHHPHNIQY